jgi:hypothetical protein
LRLHIAFASDFAAGLASAFPAIYGTTMVSLWWSQGSHVQSGAVGPMILGGTAVSGFAMSFAEYFPIFSSICTYLIIPQ